MRVETGEGRQGMTVTFAGESRVGMRRKRASGDKGGGTGDWAAGQEMNVISGGVETGPGRALPALA